MAAAADTSKWLELSNPCPENSYEDFATFLGISLRRSFNQLARRSSILSMVRHIQRPWPRRQLRVCNLRTVHGLGERSWRVLRAKSATRASLPNEVFDCEELQELHLSLLITPKLSAFSSQSSPSPSRCRRKLRQSRSCGVGRYSY